MPDCLTFDALKEKQRAIRAGFPETMGLRVHRSISWIGRAEACGVVRMISRGVDMMNGAYGVADQLSLAEIARR